MVTRPLNRPAALRRVRLRIAASAIGGCAVAGCGGSPRAPAALAATMPAIGAMRGTRVVLFPTQLALVTPPLAPRWSALGAPDSTGFLRKLDDEIAFSLKEHGLDSVWVTADAVVRSARRNPTMAPDPYRLAIAEVLSSTKRRDPAIGVELASQVRALVALQPDARYALVPTDVRFEAVPGGTRALLHLVLIDGRASNVRWTGDVPSDSAASGTPALAASIAGRLAALVTTR